MRDTYDALWLYDACDVAMRNAEPDFVPDSQVRVTCRRCDRSWQASARYLGLLAQMHPGQRVHHGMSAVAALHASAKSTSAFDW